MSTGSQFVECDKQPWSLSEWRYWWYWSADSVSFCFDGHWPASACKWNEAEGERWLQPQMVVVENSTRWMEFGWK